MTPAAPRPHPLSPSGFVATARGLLLDPSATLEALRDEPAGRAFVFGWVCLAFTPLVLAPVFPVIALWQEGALGEGLPVLFFCVGFALFCGPALAAFAALVHLAALPFGAAPRGFGVTLRATSLAQAPIVISAAFPLGLFAWAAVLTAIGMASLHGTTRLRAGLAVVTAWGLMLGALVLGLVALALATRAAP